MSQAALGRGMGVSAAAVSKLEHAEIGGGITIAKLAEVAASLDCTLVYALVPNGSLESIVERQARRVAARRLGYVASTMALEGQAVDADRLADHLDVYVRELIDRGDLWREEGPRVLSNSADG